MENKASNQTISETYLSLLRQNKRRYADRYGITRMGIFGSVARGDQNESSDVDICIEAPPMGLFDFSGLYLSMEELLGVQVNIVRMHKNMNPRFRKQIEKDVIYV